MSVETEILEALSADTALMALLGAAGKIMSGNLEKRLSLPPPLLLVEVLRGEPEIVGEEGIIVDHWNSRIWILVEGSASSLEEAVEAVMELLRFSRTTTRRVDAGRVEQEWLEMGFIGARMRI